MRLHAFAVAFGSGRTVENRSVLGNDRSVLSLRRHLDASVAAFVGEFLFADGRLRIVVSLALTSRDIS